MKNKNEYKYKLYNSYLKRYPNIPREIIFYVVDMAPTSGFTFDLLEEFPQEYPLCLADGNTRWVSGIIDEFAYFQEET